MRSLIWAFILMLIASPVQSAGVFTLSGTVLPRFGAKVESVRITQRGATISTLLVGSNGRQAFEVHLQAPEGVTVEMGSQPLSNGVILRSPGGKTSLVLEAAHSLRDPASTAVNRVPQHIRLMIITM